MAGHFVLLPGQVFPARAGMIPEAQRIKAAVLSIPRESGDDPFSRKSKTCDVRYSPRERG